MEEDGAETQMDDQEAPSGDRVAEIERDDQEACPRQYTDRYTLYTESEEKNQLGYLKTCPLSLRKIFFLCNH